MKKNLLFIVAAAAIGLGCFFYLSTQPSTNTTVTSNTATSLHQRIADAMATPQKTSNYTNTQASSSSTHRGAWGRKLTATEMAVKHDWYRRTGQSTEYKNGYKVYSDDQLEEMVKKGDIYAMEVLGERKLVGEGGVEAAIYYAEKSIVHGSLSGIMSMGNYTGPKNDRLPFPEIKQQLMESEAYYSLLALRGDPYTAALQKDTQTSLFAEKYKLNEVFNASEKEWIANRANELYEQYQAERRNIGLGDFSNEMPEEVRNFFDPKY